MSKGEQTLSTNLPNNPDGFRIALDTSRERADIVLQRPPLNVVAMPQREQLRQTFEALDRDERIRVIVLRAEGEHFSSGGNIQGFLDSTPEEVSDLATNIAAPARCPNSESRRYPALVDQYVCCI